MASTIISCFQHISDSYTGLCTLLYAPSVIEALLLRLCNRDNGLDHVLDEESQVNPNPSSPSPSHMACACLQTIFSSLVQSIHVPKQLRCDDDDKNGNGDILVLAIHTAERCAPSFVDVFRRDKTAVKFLALRVLVDILNIMSDENAVVADTPAAAAAVAKDSDVTRYRYKDHEAVWGEDLREALAEVFRTKMRE